MIIRELKKEDESQFKKLLRGFYILDKNRFSDKLQRWEKYKDDDKLIDETARQYLFDKNYMVFVSEENGELIGYICGTIKDKPQKIYDREGYVEDWFVEVNQRNEKIGEGLFNALINKFKELKCTHIALDSFVENEIAINIYHRMGFEDKLIVLRKDLN